MVFYVVAAALPGKQEKENDQVLASSVVVNGRQAGQIYPVKVEKQRFKIGSLDSLMELNETLVKVDQTLDTTTKKIERLATEMSKTDLFIEVSNRGDQKTVTPLDYLRNFTWEQMRYNSGRPLVEIAGQISELMKKIDNDIKKQQDDLTELRNQHSQLVKKEGTNFLSQDVSEAIYSYDKLKVNEVFIEKASSAGSTMFQTLIAIVHRTKVDQFIQNYELVIDWEMGSLDFSVIPRSAKYTGIEDKDGYQLWRIIVLKEKTQDYLKKSKERGLFIRSFDYNYEKYQEELKERTRLEHAIDLARNKLATKCLYAFSELYIALIHLKVMRAFIDGVLRFGIPAWFALAIVQPFKGQDKAILHNLNERFDDKQFSDMYATGGKGEAGLNEEEFFSFVNIPLTSPISLMGI